MRDRTSKASDLDRRQFLRAGLGAAAVVAVTGSALLAGCGDGGSAPAPTAAEKPPAPAPAAPPAAAPAPPPPAAAAPSETGGSPEAPVTDTAPNVALVTDIPANAALVSTLQYVNEAKDPAKVCSGCQLYTPTIPGRGKCTLFTQGLVLAKGHCVSWIQRQA